MRVRDQRRRALTMMNEQKQCDDQNRQDIDVLNLQLQGLKYEIGYYQGVSDGYKNVDGQRTKCLNKAFYGFRKGSPQNEMVQKFHKMTAEKLNQTSSD